jgi:hypothetical protein
MGGISNQATWPKTKKQIFKKKKIVLPPSLNIGISTKTQIY